MRLIPLAILLSAVALGAGDPRTVTYVSGDLEGVAPQSGAVLDVTGARSLSLRVGEKAFEVPYSSISSAEAGDITTLDTDEPLYKVWSLHKRFAKRQLQQVKVGYKGAAGENRMVVLEMDRAIAERVLARLEDATVEPAERAWWGDSIWKTKRNQDQWGGTGTVATRE
jgi:hypothetical protein